MKREDIEDLKIGDWVFINGHSFIGILFGEGRFDMCILPIFKTGDVPTKTPSWAWNGDEEKPTLSPSILIWGNGKDNPATWHGYLINGELVES